MRKFMNVHFACMTERPPARTPARTRHDRRRRPSRYLISMWFDTQGASGRKSYAAPDLEMSTFTRRCIKMIVQIPSLWAFEPANQQRAMREVMEGSIIPALGFPWLNIHEGERLHDQLDEAPGSSQSTT